MAREAGVKVRFFGKLGEAIGREVDIEPPAADQSVAQLRAMLAGLYPQWRDELAAATLKACVDDTIVDDGFRIRPGVTVEFFPPLSGG